MIPWPYPRQGGIFFFSTSSCFGMRRCYSVQFSSRWYSHPFVSLSKVLWVLTRGCYWPSLHFCSRQLPGSKRSDHRVRQRLSVVTCYLLTSLLCIHKESNLCLLSTIVLYGVSHIAIVLHTTVIFCDSGRVCNRVMGFFWSPMCHLVVSSFFIK